jgi:hypothetical protein
MPRPAVESSLGLLKIKGHPCGWRVMMGQTSQEDLGFHSQDSRSLWRVGSRVMALGAIGRVGRRIKTRSCHLLIRQQQGQPAQTVLT